MIPRERKLVRVYVELPPSVAMRYREDQDGEVLMHQVAKVMQPYMMETKHIEWSTTYTVHAFQKIPPLLQDQELTDPLGWSTSLSKDRAAQPHLSGW